jgi:hypothetical protein
MKCINDAIEQLRLNYWQNSVLDWLEDAWLTEACDLESQGKPFAEIDFAELRTIVMLSPCGRDYFGEISLRRHGWNEVTKDRLIAILSKHI